MDVDADGFAWTEDCDDADPSAFPGAEEQPYDGVDQDCDGIDADDLDGDGFPQALDCDDQNAGAFPGAAETCDGVDQDCDGATDEGVLDTKSGFLDADGDGFGDPAAPWTGCAVLGPADGADCDDADPGVFPGAGETCDDLVDNDCDGFIDQMVAGWTQETVQAAIDAACADGDTVWVSPGTFYETVVIERPITLEAIEDRSTTVLDASTCTGDCPVVTVAADQATLRGLTITGGHRINTDGGGVYANGVDDLIVESCLVSANTSTGGWGGGVAVLSSSWRIIDSEISGNTATPGYGGGIYARNGAYGVLEGSRLHDNSAYMGGGVLLYNVSGVVVLVSNTIEGNTASYGGGAFFSNVNDLITAGNVVSGNAATGTSDWVGGGVYGQTEWTSHADTISGNTPDDTCP